MKKKLDKNKADARFRRHAASRILSGLLGLEGMNFDEAISRSILLADDLLETLMEVEASEAQKLIAKKIKNK